MKGDLIMRFNRFGKLIAGAAFAFAVLFSAGMISGTTAQAQDRNRDQRWNRSQNQSADRNGVRTERSERSERRDQSRIQSTDQQRRWERERVQRERSRVFVQPRYYPRTIPYGGYRNGSYGTYGGGYGGYRNGGYGSYGGGYGGGYNNGEVQRGYRDGLDRGQEDARDRRSPNPNNSSHFRSGNSAYREGFVRGYQDGYRQFGGGRRW
jgi:hypothetical protein